MVVINPYSAGGIVKDPAMFFGREEELRRIRDRLRKGDSTAVVGLRRIGKSSLLYQLAHQADKLPEGVIAVYLDLQDAAHHRPFDLLSSALHHLDGLLNYRFNFSPVKSLADFSVAIKQVTVDGFQAALCLDEVEELTEREIFDDDFFECLRSLSSQRMLAFVTASGDSLDLLIKQSGRISKFYNVFTNLDLAGLSDDAALALLVTPFQTAGLKVPPADYVAEVLDLAGHFPFYLQMAAYHLFEARRRDDVVDRHALRTAFAQDAERHFYGLWQHLSADERTGVKRLVGLATTTYDWDRTRADLLRCGLAEGDPENPRLFSVLLAEMIKAGKMDRVHSVRRRSDRIHSLKKEKDSTQPLYAYILVALASVAISLVIALLLPPDRFWPFFVILTVVLTFVLVLADRLTGEHFLKWLSHLLGKWG